MFLYIQNLCVIAIQKNKLSFSLGHESGIHLLGFKIGSVGKVLEGKEKFEYNHTPKTGLEQVCLWWNDVWSEINCF